MITIDEKLKLFTKIVKDKVDKENQSAIDKFNAEYGNLLDKKKAEFKAEGDRIFEEGMKNIDKERLQIMSKARIDEKRVILETRKKIFDEALDDLCQYGETYAKTPEYKGTVLKDLQSALDEIPENSSVEVYITSRDNDSFGDDIKKMLSTRNFNIQNDDDIIGGFIVIDTEHGIKIDMSFLSKIDISREYIGERLFEMLQ